MLYFSDKLLSHLCVFSSKNCCVTDIFFCNKIDRGTSQFEPCCWEEKINVTFILYAIAIHWLNNCWVLRHLSHWATLGWVTMVMKGICGLVARGSKIFNFLWPHLISKMLNFGLYELKTICFPGFKNVLFSGQGLSFHGFKRPSETKMWLNSVL